MCGRLSDVDQPSTCLGIDCGTVETRAVLRHPDGRVTFLTFDGAPQLPSGVFVYADGTITTGVQAQRDADQCLQRFVPAPISLIKTGTVIVDDYEVSAVDLLVAVLRRVADEAALHGVLGRTVLVVPPSWGPGRRTLLRRAAGRAGLTSLTLIDTPVAAIHRLQTLGVSIPPGAPVLIADAGGGFTASVVDRTDVAEVSSVLTVDDAGGTQLDRLIIDHLTTIHTHAGLATTAPQTAVTDTLVRTARTVKESLSVHRVVLASLDGDLPPVVVAAEHIETLTRPVIDTMVDTCRRAITAADLTPADLAGVYLIGGSASLPTLAPALREALPIPVIVVHDPATVAILGAIGTDTPAAAADIPAATIDAPPSIRRIVAVAIPAVASLVLVVNGYTTAVTGETRDFRGATYRYVNTNWGELALATTFAILACLVAATTLTGLLAPATRTAPTGQQRNPLPPITAALITAVALGMGIGGLYASTGSLIFGLPIGPFLRWALLPNLPLAATIVLIAALAGRVTPIDGWHRFLSFPTGSITTATIATLAIEYSLTTGTTPDHELFLQVTGRLGAFALGVATALALARHVLWRILLALPLAAYTTFTLSAWATGILAVVYITAATWWAIRHIWSLHQNT